MSASVEQRETPPIFLNIRERFLNTRERSTGGSADPGIKVPGSAVLLAFEVEEPFNNLKYLEETHLTGD